MLQYSPDAEVQNPRSPTQNNTDQQREDNNKTIYPTPIFEEVLPRLVSQNVAGEPPATPGENRKTENTGMTSPGARTLDRYKSLSCRDRYSYDLSWGYNMHTVVRP